MAHDDSEPVEIVSFVSTQSAGQTTDDGKARIFPCDGCGADLEFNIGQQSLKCPYCGFVKELEISGTTEVGEQDFHAMLERLADLRHQGTSDEQQTSEVRCESCSGTVVFTGTLSSSECPYCASPIQLERVHDSPQRVPVDGVIPFLVDQKKAGNQLKLWVSSRWFAPNDFVDHAMQGKFNGVYLPYWTFDTMTANAYTGERGEHYYVTVGTGKEERKERRTRWYPAAGHFDRFFDDVLSFAATGLPQWIMLKLEPWPMSHCVPFNQQMLAGFLARTYDIPLDEGFADARKRIDAEIQADVRRRIGGDDQRVSSVRTFHNAITYKHLLLPVWLMAYRYKDKPYQLAINAATGEVHGERPYSFAKILLFILAILGVIATVFGITALTGAIGTAIGAH